MGEQQRRAALVRWRRGTLGPNQNGSKARIEAWLRRGNRSTSFDLCERFDLDLRQVHGALNSIRTSGVRVTLMGGKYEIAP